MAPSMQITANPRGIQLELFRSVDLEVASCVVVIGVSPHLSAGEALGAANEFCLH